MKGKILTSLTVVVEHDMETEHGKAFVVCANEAGGSNSKRLSQEQLDALTVWLDALDMGDDGERRRSVTLTEEAWSHVHDALVRFLAGADTDATIDGNGDIATGYELRYGGSQLRDALASIVEQTR